MHLAMILAALIIGSPAQAKSVSEWHRWFAWYPVEIDAYTVKELRHGKFHYRVWLCWVEYRWAVVPQDDEDGTEWQGWKYRLPQ